MVWLRRQVARALGALGLASAGRQFRRQPGVESLEIRGMMSAVAGVDYLLSGYKWLDPGHITYGIVPDGVQWDHGITNLNATFNARFGNGPWQRAIAAALATWEAAANINIALVGDSGLPFNTPGQAQGDPRFGDIRFAGYAFPGDTTTLARTYYPPPDGGTGAGDDEINTTMSFNLGSDYDLYSVMLHETGLALGLAEIAQPAEVMDGIYEGVRSGLSAGDLAGIQALYGPRTPDAFQQQGQGLTPASAIDLTAQLSAAHQATLNNVSLATIGDTEYFSVVAPSFSGATLEVTAAAGNISLLSPQVTILGAAGQTLAVAANAAAWSDNVTAQTSQIVPGQRYTIAVTGATRDFFAVGAYQLAVNFAGDPSVASPPAGATSGSAPSSSSSPAPAAAGTTASLTAPGVPVASMPGDATGAGAGPTALGTVSTASVSGLLARGSTGQSFTFRTARAGVYRIEAPGTAIQVHDAAGHRVAGGAGVVTVQSRHAGATFLVKIGAAGGTPVASYSLSISLASAGMHLHGRALAPAPRPVHRP
jgi:hypothetical protein